MAEGVGFEPTVALRLLLISSQMPLTTQPPFRRVLQNQNLSAATIFMKINRPSNRGKENPLSIIVHESIFSK